MLKCYSCAMCYGGEVMSETIPNLVVKSYTSIRLERSTVERLKKYGKYGEDYNDIIVRLLDMLPKRFRRVERA